MNFVTLAVKNLMRRRGRTVLTVLGVAIAISVLFSLIALNTGYEIELNREMNSLGAHILAVPKGCPYEAASLMIHGGVIPKYLNISDLEMVSSIEGVEVASPLLMYQFYKRDEATGQNNPHIVYGVEMKEMSQIKPWWRVEGRFFEDDEKKVKVVGRELAVKENLTVGQVMPFGPDREDFTIVGILERTGDQDDLIHFLPLPEAQRLSNKEGKITTIAVKVEDLGKIGAVAVEMEKVPDIQAVTMTQIMGTITNLTGSARSLLMTVISIAMVISAFGILNTLLMSVNERTREFGMLKAIGASGLDIGKMIMAETLIITTLGGLMGTVMAVAGSTIIEGFVKEMLPYAPLGSFIHITPELVAFSLLFSVVLGIICGIYPAFKSSRLTPMEAIRGGFE